MIEEKKALAEQIVGTGESWLDRPVHGASCARCVALSADAVPE